MCFTAMQVGLTQHSSECAVPMVETHLLSVLVPAEWKKEGPTFLGLII